MSPRLHDLVLLTSAFPFGNKSETFLESELEVLAPRFSRIFLLPAKAEPGTRPLPANVEVVRMPWLAEPPSAVRRRALLSRQAARVLARTLRHAANRGPYAGAARTYLDLLARNVLKYRDLVRFVRERGLGDAIFYDYWFENATLALALARHAGAVRTAVCRAHRFDLYDEGWPGPVPFREAKAEALDAVFVVSDFGADYLERRLPPGTGRVRVARLGVRDPGRAARRGGEGVPTVVSCSSLLPGKRVHRIPEALAALERPVHWVHLGDGPDRARVETAARAMPGEVTWELRGHVDNADVLRFYREHRVDAMISLTESEGLPVSMMEAVSFGVPVVATGVHGVPEIVNDTTGVVLRPGASADEGAAGLRAALEPGRFDADRIRAFFREHYDAGTNYDRFADALIDLHEGPAPPA